MASSTSSASSSSSSSSRDSSSPEPPKTKAKSLKRKVQQTQDDSESDQSGSDSDSDSPPAAENDEPPLSHAERRKQKKKAEKIKTAAEDPSSSSSKKRKLKDGSAAAVGSKETKTPRQNSVWVGNLSFKTTQENLRTFFASAGEVTRINMPMKPPSRPNLPRENKGLVPFLFPFPFAGVSYRRIGANEYTPSSSLSLLSWWDLGSPTSISQRPKRRLLLLRFRNSRWLGGSC